MRKSLMDVSSMHLNFFFAKYYSCIPEVVADFDNNLFIRIFYASTTGINDFFKDCISMEIISRISVNSDSIFVSLF